jgi:hypothetical protein
MGVQFADSPSERDWYRREFSTSDGSNIVACLKEQLVTPDGSDAAVGFAAYVMRFAVSVEMRVRVSSRWVEAWSAWCCKSACWDALYKLTFFVSVGVAAACCSGFVVIYVTHVGVLLLLLLAYWAGAAVAAGRVMLCE